MAFGYNCVFCEFLLTGFGEIGIITLMPILNKHLCFLLGKDKHVRTFANFVEIYI